MTDEQAKALLGANETADTTAGKEGDKEDEFLSWNDLDNDDDEGETDKNKEEGGKENLDNGSDTDNLDDDKGKVEKPESKDKEWWEVAAEKTGVEAKDEAEFIEKSKNKEAVKEVFVDEKDPAIRKLKGYTKLNDEDLVRADRKARGWDADKIDRYIEKNKDNVEFEAEDIRATLNQTIAEHQRTKETEENNKAEARKQEVITLQKNVKDHLSKTTEVLGFKVGRDEQGIQKWQQGMEKYLNQNGIFKDFDKIVKDAIDGKPEQLVELAQFIKGKDGIVKGLMQKGKSKEAEKFLTDLQNSGDDAKPKGESADTGVAKKNLDAWVH